MVASKVLVVSTVAVLVGSFLSGCGADIPESSGEVVENETSEPATSSVVADDEEEITYDDAPGLKPLWFLEVADPFGDARVDDIVVDRGLFSVSVTVPSDFFSLITDEEILVSSREAGYPVAEIQPDRSVVFELSTGRHNSMLKEMRSELDKTIAGATTENPGVFTDITFDQDVTRFVVEVNRAAFEESLEAFWIGFSLGLGGLFYQIFAGVSEEQRNVVIDLTDASTGEVFDSQVWPGED